MRLSIVITLFLLSLTGCSEKNKLPSGILPMGKMQSVLWDIIQADVFTNTFIKKDSSKNLVEENARLQQQVFTIHHVTKEDFYTSYAYYKYHPDLMGPLLDSMIAQKGRARRKKTETKNVFSLQN